MKFFLFLCVKIMYNISRGEDMRIDNHIIKENLTKEELIKAGFYRYNEKKLYFLKKLDKFISLHITAPVSEKGEINSREIKSWVQNDISLELYLPYYKLFKQQENINLELDSGYLLLDESEDDLEIYSRLYNEKVNLLAHSYDLINDEDVFNPNLNDVVNNYNIVMKGLCEEDILEETKYDKVRVRK